MTLISRVFSVVLYFTFLAISDASVHPISVEQTISAPTHPYTILEFMYTFHKDLNSLLTFTVMSFPGLGLCITSPSTCPSAFQEWPQRT